MDQVIQRWYQQMQAQIKNLASDLITFMQMVFIGGKSISRMVTQSSESSIKEFSIGVHHNLIETMENNEQ